MRGAHLQPRTDAVGGECEVEEVATRDASGSQVENAAEELSILPGQLILRPPFATSLESGRGARVDRRVLQFNAWTQRRQPQIVVGDRLRRPLPLLGALLDVVALTKMKRAAPSLIHRTYPLSVYSGVPVGVGTMAAASVGCRRRMSTCIQHFQDESLVKFASQ